MAFVQLRNIGISFADRQILKDVNLTISSGRCMALSGFNGSGKSTLMKIMAGLIEQDEGEVICPGDTDISYLPQSELITSDNTVLEEAMKAVPSDDVSSTLQQRQKAGSRLLGGLGFSSEDFDQKASSLSSGWQMRVALARVLLESPDILLLDEPTNYLDLEAREWLERFLKHFPGAILLISHDRSFLENVCDSVAWLQSSCLRVYHGSYSDYEKQFNAALKGQEQRWKQQKREIARIQAYINRFRYNSRKAPQVQSRIKMLEKMDIVPPPSVFKTINFSFSPTESETRIPLRCENLGRRYGTHLVFEHLNLLLQQGSRTAVVGHNGAGKTTLLRIIAGEDRNYEGRLIPGRGVRVGYFSVEQKLSLNNGLSVFEEVCSQTRRDESFVRDLLGVFMFSGDDIHKRVAVLSGGELSRLALARILLQPFNFLILDEPTNHLDMYSREALLNALEGFRGTLIIVSHDRYFLDRIAGQVLELEEGQCRLYPGSWSYYRERKARERAGTSRVEREGAERSRSVISGPGRIRKPGVQRSTPKNHQEEHKRRRNRLTSLRRQEESLLNRLECSEVKVQGLRESLAVPENYSDPQRARLISEELASEEEIMADITREWEITAGTLEEMEAGGSK